MIQQIKQGVLWFGLICLVFSFLGCGGPEERKMKYYEKGKALLQQGNYRDARLELKNAVQVDPKFVDGFFLLGKIEFEKKNIGQAVKYFNRVVKLSPDHVEARLMLAEIGFLAKEYDFALENIREVQKLQPGNVKAQITEGLVYNYTEKKPQARKIAEKLLKEGNHDPEVYLLLAATYSSVNERNIIEDTYKKGLAENPKSSRLLQSLIALYVSERRNEEAIQLLEKVIEIEPDAVIHKFRMAQLLWNTGRQNDAEKIMDALSSSGFKNEDTALMSATFYASNKKLDRAERILLDALEKNSNNFKYRFALSDLYVFQGKYQEAIKTLEQQLLLNQGKTDTQILRTRNDLARLYLVVGNTDKALEYVDKIIAVNQQDRDAHFTKGKIFLIRGEGDKAVNEFRPITTGNPNFIEGHLRLAEALVVNKSYEQATSALLKALEVNAESKELLRGLASLYVLKNERDKAENQFRKILDIYPDDFQTRLGLADLLYKQNKPREAKGEYDKLAALAPDNPIPYLRLSRLYWRDGRMQEAVSILKRGQSINQASPELFTALIELYLKQKQFNKAIEVSLQKQREDPDNPYYYYMLGQVYAAAQKNDLAEKQLNKAIELAPTWLAPVKGLADLYTAQGKADEAISRMEAIVRDNPDRHEIYITLALLYEQQKKYEKTISTYERALTADPKNWVAANNAAYALMEHQGNNESMQKALMFAEKARELRPQSKEIADTLAWAYFNNENYPRALTIIKNDFSIPPEDPTILFHIASILYKNGKIAEAKENMMKALENEGHFPWREQAKTLLQKIIANN